MKPSPKPATRCHLKMKDKLTTLPCLPGFGPLLRPLLKPTDTTKMLEFPQVKNQALSWTVLPQRVPFPLYHRQEHHDLTLFRLLPTLIHHSLSLLSLPTTRKPTKPLRRPQTVSTRHDTGKPKFRYPLSTFGTAAIHLGRYNLVPSLPRQNR